MKLLNISDIKSTSNKSVIEEYDEDGDFEGYNIYSNKIAVFISNSEQEILDNIKNAYNEIFSSKNKKQLFKFNNNELEIKNIGPRGCPNCDSINLDHSNSDFYDYLCLDCGNKYSERQDSNIKNISTITIHKYSKEQLLIIELYDEYLNPYPDNFMFVRYLLKNIKDN